MNDRKGENIAGSGCRLGWGKHVCMLVGEWV